MIQIIPAHRKSAPEWCVCCMSDKDTKRIHFSHDGYCGTSVVLCKNCREELKELLGNND